MSLDIYLLGQFKLISRDLSIELPSRPAQSLLAYLALNAGTTFRREKLASLLWCDATEANARSYLRQALWRIRKSLERASLSPEDYLQINEISVTFTPPPDCWLDVQQLLQPAESRSLDELLEDISLYRGELLPGFYDEWVGFERDRFLAAYHQKMSVLLERLSQKRRWDDVLKWAEQWIRLGYSPEAAFTAQIKAYAALGNPGMINVTYQRCVEALNRELGVEPSPETTRLYETLQRASHIETSPPMHAYESAPLSQPPFFSADWLPPRLDQAVFVAREGELNQLDAYLNQALSGHGRVVFITGEAGSGKTSLVNAFTCSSKDRHAGLVVAGGNCNAQTGIGDPYLPFREILELLCGDVESRWLAGAIPRDEAQMLWNLMPLTCQALVDVGADLLDTFISGAALYERAATYSSVAGNCPIRLESLLQHSRKDAVVRDAHQSDLFIQYSKVLHAIARQAPLILIVDDLQWADLGSISLLFHLGRSLAGTRILILGAYRPEEVALGRGGQRHPLEAVVHELKRLFGEIELNLDQAERRTFIEQLLDSEPNRLGSQFRDMLFGLTNGHPLFTIELLRGMQERGDLVKDPGGQWIEGPALDWETLPARVEAVIEERISRLDQSLQSILRTASVEGESFTAEVVASVQSRLEADVLNRLSDELDRKHHLIRAQSIQRMDGQLISTYRFQHILLQRYLYNSLDEVERVHLHERVGSSLESLYAAQTRTSLISPQLARHFQEARITKKAIDYLQQAGERALQVSAYQEAIAHLEDGLAMLASSPDPGKFARQELSMQLAFSLAWHLSKGFTVPREEQAAARALELSYEVGNPTQLCQVLTALSIFKYVKGEFQLAYDFANDALDVSQRGENPLLLSLSNWCMGVVLFAHGDYPRARHHLKEVVDNYDPKHHHHNLIVLRGMDSGLSAMAYYACCLYALGFPEQADQQSQAALRLAREIGHAYTLADVLRYGGCEYYKMRRDASSLLAASLELISLSEEKNFPGWLGTGNACRGEALVLLGQHGAGIAAICSGVNVDLAVGVKCTIPGSLCYLAEGYIRIGDLEQGLRVLNEAFQMIDQTSQHTWEAEMYRTLAALQSVQGCEAEAETSLQRALHTARSQHARMWELRAALDLARLWRKQGRAEEGRQMVGEIYSGFTEGFATPELNEAGELCTG